MKRDICFLSVMAGLLALCESEAQFGFGGGAALQNCAGSNCNQNNGFGGRTFGSPPGFGSQGVAVQNCAGSNCNQNNGFGGRTFGSPPGFGSQGVAVQNCVGSNCNSNNVFG